MATRGRIDGWRCEVAADSGMSWRAGAMASLSIGFELRSVTSSDEGGDSGRLGLRVGSYLKKRVRYCSVALGLSSLTERQDPDKAESDKVTSDHFIHD